MTGREIRAWAREWARGRRGILLLAGFLAGAPLLLMLIVNKMEQGPVWTNRPVCRRYEKKG